MVSVSSSAEWTKTTSPDEAARVLLGRVKGVSKVEAETTLVTSVTTYMPSKKSSDRSAAYEVERELYLLFPRARFDFRVMLG